MIVLEQVTKDYPLNRDNRVTALKGISLEIQRGAFLIITGRSGSGKTTLLNVAAGLTRPTSGTARFEGVDWWRLRDSRQSLLRTRKIGFVFQFPSLLPALTSLENVVLPTIFDPGRDMKGVYERACDLLRTLALGDKLRSYPRQLSAGQQQRVVIARALFQKPEVLLADEPTSDLDDQTESEIMELLKGIHARTGITIVLVTHSTQLNRYGTHSLRMAGGEIL